MTVQDILKQKPYKEAINDLWDKAEDFKQAAKKWAQNTDPEKDEDLTLKSKSSHASYQNQSQYVRDLSKEIEKDTSFDDKLAHEAAKNLRGVVNAKDKEVNDFINSLDKTPLTR